MKTRTIVFCLGIGFASLSVAAHADVTVGGQKFKTCSAIAGGCSRFFTGSAMKQALCEQARVHCMQTGTWIGFDSNNKNYPGTLDKQ